MASVTKTAGTAGSVAITIRNSAGQALTPVSTPVVRWYSDAARTLGEVTLAVTGSGSSYTASWTAAQAPAGVATRYLKVVIEVSTGVFDTDADDDVSFVDAGSSIDNHYVTRAQIRALPNLSDTAKFTDAEIATAIDWFEQTFEDYTGVAWVPRTVTDERHYVTSAGTIILNHMLPRSVTAVRSYSTAAVSTAYTADELADLRLDGSGVIRRVSLGRFTSGWGLVGIDYTHGHDSPKADIVEAAKVAIRDHLLTDNVGNRQFATVTQEGIVRTSTPGEGRPFGIPFCDAVANRYRSGSVAIA